MEDEEDNTVAIVRVKIRFDPNFALYVALYDTPKHVTSMARSLHNISQDKNIWFEGVDGIGFPPTFEELTSRRTVYMQVEEYGAFPSSPEYRSNGFSDLESEAESIMSPIHETGESDLTLTVTLSTAIRLRDNLTNAPEDSFIMQPKEHLIRWIEMNWPCLIEELLPSSPTDIRIRRTARKPEAWETRLLKLEPDLNAKEYISVPYDAEWQVKEEREKIAIARAAERAKKEDPEFVTLLNPFAANANPLAAAQIAQVIEDAGVDYLPWYLSSAGCARPDGTKPTPIMAPDPKWELKNPFDWEQNLLAVLAVLAAMTQGQVGRVRDLLGEAVCERRTRWRNTQKRLLAQDVEAVVEQVIGWREEGVIDGVESDEGESDGDEGESDGDEGDDHERVSIMEETASEDETEEMEMEWTA